MATDDASRTHTSTTSSYVYDNAGQQAPQRFAGLAGVYDPGTIRHLSERGVGPGWHCLEVGAGGGSIALWLAEQVGAEGFVLATDIDTRFLDELARPNLEIRRHDIGADPLPEAAFDLVHTRLVLVHLPERERVLERLVMAVKPGGWLVIEEFGAPDMRAEPELDPTETRVKALEVLKQVTPTRGVDRLYGRRVAGRLQALGLTDIGAEGRVFRYSGGSAGAAVTRAGVEQLRDAILATGLITEQEFEADLARLDDPSVAYPSPLLWTTWGRRPLAQ
jgi:SAM-dependent methyltransferase